MRNSYPSIEQKIHPDAKLRDFAFDSGINKTEEFNHIIKELLDELENFLDQFDDGTGEWDWLQKNKQSNFINALKKRDVEEIKNYFSNMFRNEVTYGYLSPSYTDVLDQEMQVSSDILCNVDACFEFTDLAREKTIGTPPIFGNPYGLKIEDKVILPDTPRHFYYAYKVSQILESISEPTIVEIGGGYGGMCAQLSKRYEGVSKCTIINIDLLPGLLASFYFLKVQGLPVNLVKNNNDFQKDVINLVPAGNLKFLDSIKSQLDLVFNSRSLCEMAIETNREYLNFINESASKYFYHENSNFLLFPDSNRHIEILAEDFPIDKEIFALKHMSLTPFTGGDGRYREYLYKRN